MAKLEVYCTVSNCHYWDEGNRCGADAILITLDRISDRFPDAFDVGRLQQIVQQVGETPADDAMATCCKTFRPRGGPRREDEDTLTL